MATIPSVGPPEETYTRTPIKDIVEVATRAVAGVSLLAYVVGLMIFNIYFGSYGLSTTLGLWRTEYFFAGSVWLILVVLTTITMWAIPRETARLQQELESKPGTRVGKIAKIGYQAALSAFGVAMALELLTGDYHAIHKVSFWKAFSALGVIYVAGVRPYFHIFNGGLLYIRIQRAKQRQGTSDEVLHMESSLKTIYRDWHRLAVLSVYMFIASIFVYAAWVFPVISPTFGGGRPTSIQLIPKPEAVSTLKAVGITMMDEHITQPMDLVLETGDSYLLIPPSDKGPGTPKAIVLQRSSIESVLYLQPKQEPF